MLNFCAICKNPNCTVKDYLDTDCHGFVPGNIGHVFTPLDLIELHSLFKAQSIAHKKRELNDQFVKRERAYFNDRIDKLEKRNKELSDKLDVRDNDIAWLKKALSIALEKLPNHTIRFSADVEISPDSLHLDENLSGDLLIRFSPVKEGDD